MLKKLVGKYAAGLVKDGDVIGLGTGSTTLEFIKSLGERIKNEGMEVYGIPTSFQSKILGIENKINIVSVDQYTPEKAFDGADEVDPHNFLIKGRGAAILQEKIDLGLVPRGEGIKAAKEGRTSLDGDIPINMDGGLKSKGHPVGATGAGMFCEIWKQLRGEAGKRQIPDAEIGMISNVGGSGASAGVFILRR